MDRFGSVSAAGLSSKNNAATILTSCSARKHGCTIGQTSALSFAGSGAMAGLSFAGSGAMGGKLRIPTAPAFPLRSIRDAKVLKLFAMTIREIDNTVNYVLLEAAILSSSFRCLPRPNKSLEVVIAGANAGHKPYCWKQEMFWVEGGCMERRRGRLVRDCLTHIFQTSKLGLIQMCRGRVLDGSSAVKAGFYSRCLWIVILFRGKGRLLQQYIESGVVVLLLCLAQELYMRAERVTLLQNFLKQCDEANQREYSKRFLHLSPLDLSKHAECDEATYDEIGVYLLSI
ncbi:hypothetical protein CASFOL_011467 [Castilleja foliolosa]|uniref:Uncharacterized protein n=1 Tax=Castilleja foliolosa TaxID=1961234 RepID=A0ABD3DW58_9LAMI